MSKYNPVQWFNQDINDYETIGYRRGLKLNGKEVFYIGESKIIVTCPTNNHKPSKTERLVMSAGAENRSDENNDKTQVASAKPAPEPTKELNQQECMIVCTKQTRDLEVRAWTEMPMKDLQTTG